jgi:predicted RNA-binding protein with PUA-like domain
VDVKAVGEMRRAVDLKEMKHLKEFVLLKQPRLSVVPVPDLIWDTICHLGGGYHGDGNPEPNPTD